MLDARYSILDVVAPSARLRRAQSSRSRQACRRRLNDPQIFGGWPQCRTLNIPSKWDCKVAEAILQEQNPLITPSKGVSPEPLSIFTAMQSYYSIWNMGDFSWYRIAISPAITGHNRDAGSCKGPRGCFLLKVYWKICLQIREGWSILLHLISGS